jgi:hypothetical protein
MPLDVGGGHAESIEIDAGVSYRILQGGPLEPDKPEWHVRPDETLGVHLIREDVKLLEVMRSSDGGLARRTT